MIFQEWIYPACVVLAAYTVLGITGFGSALIAVPFLTWIWPLPEVVVLVILLDIPASILHGGLNFRLVRLRAVVEMMPGMAVGTIMGLWLLGQLDKRWPLFLLGVYMVIVGVRALRQTAPASDRVPYWGYSLVSALIGMVQVMFATAGPVVLALLQRRLKDVAEIRATVPVVMVVAGCIAIAVLFQSGKIGGGDMLQRWLIGLPIAWLGVWFGNRVASRIPPAYMRHIMDLLLITSGIFLTRHLWP